MHPSLKYNIFFQHHMRAVGGGGFDNPFTPNVYTIRQSLKRGQGQYFLRRRGLGLGSFFTSLWQKATPLLKNIGAHAVDVVSHIAKDALHGENIKESAVRNLKEAVAPIVSNLIKTPDTSTANEINNPLPPITSESVTVSQPSRKRSKITPSYSVKKRKKILRAKPQYTGLQKLL